MSKIDKVEITGKMVRIQAGKAEVIVFVNTNGDLQVDGHRPDEEYVICESIKTE